MQRNINFFVYEYYHLYNRGTDKREIFLEPHDYNRFVALLYLCNSTNPVDISKHFLQNLDFSDIFEIDRGETLVDVVSYCLMPNHFHILVREKTEGGIQKLIMKLCTGYSMYFNRKNTRTGVLFEGRFKAKHVDSDEYLKYLFAYIHLNPIKIIEPKWKENGIKDREAAQEYLLKYRYSSYLDWQNKARLQSKIINKKASPEYFTTEKDFNDFIKDWLTFGSSEPKQ